MSAHELMEWAAFENVHGPLLLHERMDIGLAKVCFYLVSVMAASKRKHYKFRDFLPDWITDRARQTDERQLHALFEFWANQGEPDAGNLDADR